MMVFSDKIGVHDDIGFYTSYSYFIEFPAGRLYMGLQAGFNSLTSDFNKLRLRSPDDPLLSGVRTITNPNFGTGALFKGRNYFVSLSVPYLLNNDIVNIDVESIATEKRNYYFYAGGVVAINEALKLKPSTLVRMQEGTPISVDVNAEFVIRDRISFGASYRSIDSWVFLFQFEISESLHLGYAYDAIRSDLNQFSRGSHEVMINYRFRIEPVQKKGIDCPSYW